MTYTQTSRNLDTIRTDVVGSLLRSDEVRRARERFDDGEIEADALQEVENQAVREAISLQESIGLDVVTDGEIRRLNFQDSFGAAVEGYDTVQSQLRAYARTVEGQSPLQRFEIPDLALPGTAVAHRRPAKQRLKLRRNVPLDEYRYAASVAKAPVKVALIGPDRIAQRFDHQASTAVYRDLDDFIADVVRIEREMIDGVVAAGCRYVHIDAPGYTAYVDPPSLEQMRARGEDPDRNLARSLEADAALIANFPDVTFGIHLCRGNQRSMWHREGSYDAIAERLFTELPHQRFLLEYDSPRAGGFAPLRFVPKGKVVVLGLVSSKVAELESLDDLRRRIDEASRYLPLEQLAISPQCGFASDFLGNLITPEDQRRKLELVVEAARLVWGHA